jgi:DNA-binding GntR family transcriptional regulator
MPSVLTAKIADAPRLIRDGIYDRIRDEILSCALAPGAQFHEQDLAQRYEVSKSPIRDALLRLQEQNLVEVLPRRGYRVRPVSVADALEMYEMRLLYERACAARTIDHASDADIARLDVYRNSPAGNDMPAWIAYNRHFHIAMAGLCGNLRLARAAIDIIEHFDRLTYVSVTSPDAGTEAGLQRFVAEHVAIIDALKARDKRQVAALIKEHTESSRKRTIDAIANPAVVP